METSRGCPYHCTFCAKENFRNAYRKRPLPTVLDELDALIHAGVEYVYFIDEIFLPNKELLEALVDRPIAFGVQTRVDLWTPAMLDLLGAAGCVSIEAGVESISVEGRNLLDKKSRLTTDEISQRLIHARQTVPFVQANLLDARVDAADAVEEWRQHLIAHGVWANKPVPLFPYPGSPDYARRWGQPDDDAWERAVEHYLASFDQFSDIQDARPLPLARLEIDVPHGAR
jgi:B12-binding domain/radical SAM domain protein of rhizo-twelve system